MAGHIFVFEGPDYTGKTSVTKMVDDALSAKYPNRVVSFRAPGGTPEAEQIRDFCRSAPINPVAQALAYSTSFAISYDEIMKHYNAGRIVLLDRWVWSAMAYQLPQIREEYKNTVYPDLFKTLLQSFVDFSIFKTIFLHASNDVLERRLEVTQKTEAQDRFETSGREYRDRVRAEYRKAFINDQYYFNQGHWAFLNIDTTLPTSIEVARLVTARIMTEITLTEKTLP